MLDFLLTWIVIGIVKNTSQLFKHKNKQSIDEFSSSMLWLYIYVATSNLFFYFVDFNNNQINGYY